MGLGVMDKQMVPRNFAALTPQLCLGMWLEELAVKQVASGGKINS